MFRVFVVFLTITTAALALVGCGDGQPVAGTRADAPPTAVPVADIPGRDVDGFAPGVDDAAAVVGVAIGGSLPLRAFPGIDRATIANIPGTETGLFGFEKAFETEDGRLWWLVRWESYQGWIEPGAAYLAAPRDTSVTVAGNLPASTFATLGELIDGVTDQYTQTPIVVEQAIDSATGSADTTIDVMVQSEYELGTRLAVVAVQDGDIWRLQQVTEYAMCRRGVTESGTCSQVDPSTE